MLTQNLPLLALYKKKDVSPKSGERSIKTFSGQQFINHYLSNSGILVFHFVYQIFFKQYLKKNHILTIT